MVASGSGKIGISGSHLAGVSLFESRSTSHISSGSLKEIKLITIIFLVALQSENNLPKIFFIHKKGRRYANNESKDRKFIKINDIK
jgi:hypothetical protein